MTSFWIPAARTFARSVLFSCRTGECSSFVIRHSSFFLILLLPLVASSQSRLEQLEATYQANLRALHAPVLQDYLRQLDLLKNQFIARNRVVDAKQVDVEIARVKSIASTTGVLPVTELEVELAPPAEGVASKSTPSTSAKGGPSTLPTLLAAEAFKSADINSKTGAIPLGSAEWRIYKLPPGTYDVLMVFGSESLAQPEQLTLGLGGREFSGSIPPDRATGSPETFRLLRLCQIKLDTEVSGSTLTVTASSTGKPLVWLKKLIFAAPKKETPSLPPAK